VFSGPFGVIEGANVPFRDATSSVRVHILGLKAHLRIGFLGERLRFCMGAIPFSALRGVIGDDRGQLPSEKTFSHEKQPVPSRARM
jgi:hypothetical protein